jgi:arginyl-tRNA synthetase
LNLFAEFARVVRAELEALATDGALPAGLDTAKLVVEPPRERSHGDVTTNAAMVLSKQAGKPPRAIADLLAARLKMHADVETVEIAGPGFVNLTLKPSYWPRIVHAVLSEGEAFG